MNKYITLFEQFLQETDWSYTLHTTDEEAGLGFLSAKATGDNCRLDVVFDADPAKDIAMCFVYFPFIVPATKRNEMAELVCRLNRHVAGCYEFDIDELTFRYRVSIDVEGGELVPRMIENMRDSAVAVCDRDFPAMMRVLHGGFTPKDACNAGPEAPEATPIETPPQGVMIQ